MIQHRICTLLGCKKRLPPRKVHYCSEECYRIARRAADRRARVERYDNLCDIRLEKHRQRSREGMRALYARRIAEGLTALGKPRKRKKVPNDG